MDESQIRQFFDSIGKTALSVLIDQEAVRIGRIQTELTNFCEFSLDFKRPHAWDFGKRFRRVAKLAGVEALRIHDLRHFAASTLTGAGVEDNIIGLRPY